MPQVLNQADKAVGLAQKRTVTNLVLEKKMTRTENTLVTCSMLRLLSSWLVQWIPQACIIPKRRLMTSAASHFGALVVSECATHV